MSDDLLPLETLERLSRQDGLDTRPILIRVLTDLFVQKPDHSAEEVARYEELATQLLDVVCVDARQAVARKLADDPRAPRGLIARLISDDASVAAPILARFADVPHATLLTRALDGGPIEAGAVASRSDIDASMVRILARHADDLVLETLAANEAARLIDGALGAMVDRAATAPALAAALLRRSDLDAAALAPLYLQAGPSQRARIRQALADRPHRPNPRHARGVDAALEAALTEATAKEGHGHLIAEALGDALALRPDQAARLVTEPSGEPFVMMLRAAGVKSHYVARALLLSQPEIASSIPRFFELVEIAETTTRTVAAEIVAALTGQSERAATPRHEPMFDPSGVMERAGAARAAPARRPARTGDLRHRG